MGGQDFNTPSPMRGVDASGYSAGHRGSAGTGI